MSTLKNKRDFLPFFVADGHRGMQCVAPGIGA